MRRIRSITIACAVILGMSIAAIRPAAAQHAAPPGLENVGVDEHLERRVPLGLSFRDHTGKRVTLGQLVRGERPVVLNLVYHSCPSFCSLVLDGTVAALAQQPWTVGEDFDVITVSIDPRDTPEIAADQRRRTLYRYGRDAAERGWHFLVAEETLTERELLASYGKYPAIERLAEAVGFRYQWMPRQLQYAHPGVIILLTPDGRIARYLYGLEYDANDVRIGLLEASEGRSISTVERVMLYCFRYDGSQQKYVVVAWRVMQIGGALTALLLGGFLAFFWRRELKKRRVRNTSPRLGHEVPRPDFEVRS
jgi:protein SCO1/2